MHDGDLVAGHAPSSDLLEKAGQPTMRRRNVLVAVDERQPPMTCPEQGRLPGGLLEDGRQQVIRYWSSRNPLREGG
jgi:hypothetical protein